ncbi:MAG: hypothetical protein D6812_01185, partial [Deltaproteobacteria bacterium]
MSSRWLRNGFLLACALALNCTQAPEEADLFHQIEIFSAIPGTGSAHEPEARLVAQIEGATRTIDAAFEHLENDAVV